MTEPLPTVSIAIISRDDPALGDTLRFIAANDTSLSYETIVVDASDGRLDYIAEDFPFVRWITFRPSRDKRVSIPEQRNAAVAAARGEIIVFIDASCIPGDGWLDTLVNPILLGGETMASGPTVSRGGGTVHDLAIDINRGKRYLDECGTCNLACHRGVFGEVGGFDSQFEYGSDVDFSWRAIDLGYRIRYVAEALVEHEWGGGKDNARRAFRYGVARARLYKKHPGRWKHFLRQDSYMVAYMGYLAGLPLTVFFWPYPLVILPVVVKNIGKRPFNVVTLHLVYAVGAWYELLRGWR